MLRGEPVHPDNCGDTEYNTVSVLEPEFTRVLVITVPEPGRKPLTDGDDGMQVHEKVVPGKFELSTIDVAVPEHIASAGGNADATGSGNT